MTPEKADWRLLYRWGGLAPFIILGFYLIEMGYMVVGPPIPETLLDWFNLSAERPLTAFLYQHPLDILSAGLYALLLLALNRLLRRGQEAWMDMMLLAAVLGAALFMSHRAAMLGLAQLSTDYFATSDVMLRERLLAAGESLAVLGRPTPQMPGYFFLALATFMASLAMLKRPGINRWTAWMGICAGVLIMSDHVSLILWPAAADTIMILSGPFLVLWWILIGQSLLRFSRQAPA